MLNASLICPFSKLLNNPIVNDILMTCQSHVLCTFSKLTIKERMLDSKDKDKQTTLLELLMHLQFQIFPHVNSVTLFVTANYHLKQCTYPRQEAKPPAFPPTCASAICACMCWLKRVSLTLAETPHRRLLIHSVLINRIYVMLWRLQCPQF